jgi:hypothetical protein
MVQMLERELSSCALFSWVGQSQVSVFARMGWIGRSSTASV